MTQSPCLLVRLKQGSFFTLRPQTQPISSFTPEWYAGNIYDMERAQSRVVLLPGNPSLLEPTSYDVFISGDYEVFFFGLCLHIRCHWLCQIRLFGDPRARDSEIPVQTLSFSVQVQSDDAFFAYQPSQTVICDFIDGFAFGEAMGIGVQSIVGWWTVTDVDLQNGSKVPLPYMLQFLTSWRTGRESTCVFVTGSSSRLRRHGSFQSSLNRPLHLETTASNFIFCLLQVKFREMFQLLSQSFIKNGIHRATGHWRGLSFFLLQTLARSSPFLRCWNLRDNNCQF